jgi:hypothetical protein
LRRCSILREDVPDPLHLELLEDHQVLRQDRQALQQALRLRSAPRRIERRAKTQELYVSRFSPDGVIHRKPV